MGAPVDIQEVLRTTDVFGSLSDADRTTLAMCLVERRFGPGDLVFLEGAPGATLLLVAEGTFVASVLRADGANQVLHHMGPAEVAGEMAFLDPGPRSATVRALTPAVAYELSHDTMTVLRERSPAAVRAIVAAATRDVTRRLRSLDDRIGQELESLGMSGEPGAPR